MLFAVTVIVVVAASDVDDVSTRAMTQALRASLAEGAVVVVRTASREARGSNDALYAIAEQEHATLVGAVDWTDKRRRVTVHFVRPSDHREGDREMGFDATDAPRERGRAVGFALASMLAEDEPSPEPAPVTPPPPRIVVAPPPVAPPSPPPAEAPAAPITPRSASIEALGTAAAAIKDYGGGLGLTLAFRQSLGRSFAFRIAGSARFGDVAVASASTRMMSAGAGVAFQPNIDRAGRFGVGGRLTALVQWHEVAHLSADDQEPDHESRVLPGADAAVEGTLRFADTAALVAGAGVETSFGQTDIYVHRRQVATVAPIRVFGEAGIRVSF